MRLLLAVVPVIGLLASPAAARDIACRNQAAEIQCAGGRCEVETSSFTPMSLSRNGQVLSRCAYSGCWGGRTVTRRPVGRIDFLYAPALRGEAPTRGSMGGLAVLYDRETRTAQINWGGFANVMDCGAND